MSSEMGESSQQRLLLSNCACWTGEQLLPDASIVIRGERIEAVHASSDSAMEAPGDRAEDLGGRLVLPGLVNFHTHLYSALAPGLHPVGPTDTFSGILEHLWWRMDAVHNEESIYASALLGAVICAEAGVTTIFDHHASRNLVDGSLDVVARAINEVGLKGVLCFETSDRGDVRSHIAENLRFYEAHREDDQFRGMMGLHASLTLGNRTLEQVAKARPRAMPIHVHAGESSEDLTAALSASGTGPIARLDRFGLIDQHAVIAHAVHLADEDYDTIDRIRPAIVTATMSNLNNDVGLINSSRIRECLLGTDGIGSDMVGSLRAYYLTAPVARHRETLRQMFGRRAREVVDYFFPGTGALTAGLRADITVLDYAPVAPITKETLIGHLVFGAMTGKAYMTVSDGRVVVTDGRVTTVDRASVVELARSAAHSLHKRFYG
jgi:cytosine/adenosine deaminase-related metal-dependent hydrolase